MVENITAQLGEFFGVKDGKGVLVRSVEKGSRGEKAGFRAGDVVVKVNNQPVHDTSDFTHALRSSSNTAATVTVMREKREQNLTLTLPEKKDSGNLIEDSFDVPEVSDETEQAINRADAEIARLGPALTDLQQHQAMRSREIEQRQREQQQKIQERREEIRERQREMQERVQRGLGRALSKQWAEI
jgi:serine protease Do